MSSETEQLKPCETCNGKGKNTRGQRCLDCNGTGKQESETVEIDESFEDEFSDIVEEPDADEVEEL